MSILGRRNGGGWLGWCGCLVLAAGLAGCEAQQHLKRADAALARGDARAAVRSFEAALEAKPRLADDSDFTAQYNRARRDAGLAEARRLIEGRRWDQALNAVYETMDAAPGDPDLIAALVEAHDGAAAEAFEDAVAAADQGNLDRVRELLNRSIEHNADHAAARHALSVLDDPARSPASAAYARATETAAQKQWAQVLSALDETTRQDPHHLPARALRAQATDAQKRAANLVAEASKQHNDRDLTAALATLARAQEIAPHEPAVLETTRRVGTDRAEALRLVEQARAQVAEKQWDAAIGSARQALRLDASLDAAQSVHADAARAAADAWAAKGDAELAAGRYAEAHDAFQKALAYEPGHRAGLAGVRAVSLAVGDDAASDGRWGAAMLHYMAAEGGGEAAQRLAEAKRRVEERARVAIAWSGGGSDSAALQRRIEDRIDRAIGRHPMLTQHAAGGVTYQVDLSLRAFDVGERLVNRQRLTHEYEVEHVVRNPDIPELRRAYRIKEDKVNDLRRRYDNRRQAYNRIENRVNQNPDDKEQRQRLREAKRARDEIHEELDEATDDLERIRRALRDAPTYVGVRHRETMPYNVETFEKLGELSATLNIRDPDGGTLTPIVVETDFRDADTGNRGDHRVGLRGDPIELPADDEVEEALLDEAAALAADRLIQRIVEHEAASLASAAATLEQEGRPDAALEARVDAAMVEGILNSSARDARLRELRPRP